MDGLPLGLALAAGSLAALNPCGFALLPAYLTRLVAAGDGSAAGGVVRAVRFTAGMTAGFLAVFGTAGLVLGALAASIQPALPYVTVALGLVAVVLGVRGLAGRSTGSVQLPRLGGAPRTTWLSQAGYGVAFALASLSCTIAPFLAVTSAALARADLLGVVVAFGAYAVGMGAVVLVLALAAVGARASVARALRRAGGSLGRWAGGLLLVSGLYVCWYGLWELRVLGGGAADDAVVGAVLSAQAGVARWVGERTVLVLAVAGVAALLVVLWGVRRRSRDRERDARLPEPGPAPVVRSRTPDDHDVPDAR
ncbi:cytochrome c biogenesis protein CcdA [Cellulomonas cellasea]|uniref:Cytochrome c biogenesis protein CcdA n=1 Tax=Cellulomonas cellasea TaxID=43670 RepID=A0A7W4UDS8_9CELL|nr:cytochrome c biogenesis protein CcdA [Cellulomonas cellasea]MBB2922202.1 cytochrome c biogenesis protein CcdA [Cellulomonas cellasea]